MRLQSGPGVGGRVSNKVPKARTFVVEVQLLLVVGHSLVILKVFSQLLVVGDCVVQRPACCQTLSQLGPFLADLGILQEERSSVEVVSPLSVLSSLL